MSEPAPDAAPPAMFCARNPDGAPELRAELPVHAMSVPPPANEASDLLPAAAPGARFDLVEDPKCEARPTRHPRAPRKGCPPSWWTADEPPLVLDSLVTRPGLRG